MKIAYITDQLALHGGIEKILSQKINGFIARGHEVVLITSEQNNRPFVYPIDARLEHLDLNINYVREKSYFSAVNLKKLLKHLPSLKKAIKDIKPEVIISVGFTPDQYYLPAIYKHIPKLKEIHFSGFILKNQQGRLSPKALMDRFFKSYDRVVVLNKDEQHYYPNFKTEIIPNFIDLPTARPSDNRQKLVVAAGRIAPVKQFDHLLKAWALLHNNFPGWKLKIFGSGDPMLEKHLGGLLDELDIGRSASLEGATAHMEEELQKASIFAMSSQTECFPMVLLEAQGAGVPVVSYRCPHGPENIVRDGVDGILTEDQNIVNLAAGLSRLMSDQSLLEYMGKNAGENAEQYAKDKILSFWEELFKKVMDEKNN